VLIWQRPIDFGVFLLLVTLSLWFYFSIETTVVTLASILVVIWTLVSSVLNAISFKFPWHVVLAPHETSGSVDLFADVIAWFVNLRFAITDTIEDMHRFKAANPTRFGVQIVVSGIVLAYFGSFISGQSLFIISLYSVLLVPGALANGVPEKVAVIVEPHIKVYREKLFALIAKLREQIEQQLKKARNATQQPQEKPHEKVEKAQEKVERAQEKTERSEEKLEKEVERAVEKLEEEVSVPAVPVPQAEINYDESNSHPKDD